MSVSQIKLLTLFMMISLIAGSCGTIVGNPEEDEDPLGPPAAMIADLPDVRGISLTNFGTADGAGLVTLADCEGAAGLGAFSLVYGPACIMTLLTSNSMYGVNPDKNNDDRITCDEYDTNEDNGILFSLLCEESLTNLEKVTSLHFEEDVEEIAISFLPNHDFGIGHWSARGEDALRFPSSIRVWAAKGGSDLRGVIALLLESQEKGTIYYDLEDENRLYGESTFDVKAEEDLPACRTKRDRESCHFEEFRFEGDPTDENGFLGFHMNVYANNRKKADVLMIEGKFTYTAAQAQKQFTEDSNVADSFKNIREIYFRSVQMGEQIWGSMDFKDEDGNTVVAEISEGAATFDITGILRNGHDGVDYSGICVNFGSDEWVDCEDIDYKEFSSMWQGDGFFDLKTAYTQPIDYAAPPALGLCYLEEGDQECL